jgi:sec-independent protein translocase protein TatA
MDIFGIGPGELMLIMALALMIVGPQKLPEIGRNLGRTIGEFKAQTDALRSVMTLDPTATPAPREPAAATPVAAMPVPAALEDERVVALQTYTRRTAEPGPGAAEAEVTIAPTSEAQVS